MIGVPRTDSPMARSNARVPGDDPRDAHAAARVPGLSIESCNLPLREPEDRGFIGDRASQTAFRALLDARRRGHLTGDDPFGDEDTDAIGKKDIDLVLVGGDPDAAHLVHVAVEQYASRLAWVVGCFLAQPEWKGVTDIVLGGGFPESRVGAFAIRRTRVLLAHEGVPVELHALSHDADEGGLLGWVQLLPKTMRRDHEAFLAVDIGGTNIRCGIVEHRLAQAKDGSRARVVESAHWRHADDQPGRGEAVFRLAGMLNGLVAQARTLEIALAPFVGIACPGGIGEDGLIADGAQNLPGNWEAPFDLPRELGRHLDRVGGRRPVVRLHNDAVVQGLSERPRMRGAKRWGVLTIGTGLGNASYRNRKR